MPIHAKYNRNKLGAGGDNTSSILTNQGVVPHSVDWAEQGATSRDCLVTVQSKTSGNKAVPVIKLRCRSKPELKYSS